MVYCSGVFKTAPLAAPGALSYVKSFSNEPPARPGVSQYFFNFKVETSVISYASQFGAVLSFSINN